MLYGSPAFEYFAAEVPFARLSPAEETRTYLLRTFLVMNVSFYSGRDQLEKSRRGPRPAPASAGFDRSRAEIDREEVLGSRARHRKVPEQSGKSGRKNRAAGEKLSLVIQKMFKFRLTLSPLFFDSL